MQVTYTLQLMWSVRPVHYSLSVMDGIIVPWLMDGTDGTNQQFFFTLILDSFKCETKILLWSMLSVILPPLLSNLFSLPVQQQELSQVLHCSKMIFTSLLIYCCSNLYSTRSFVSSVRSSSGYHGLIEIQQQQQEATFPNFQIWSNPAFIH